MVNSSWWLILFLAVVLAGASFLLQSRNGINLADEGFLWYGVQQTARGAVPMRDFQAYDPGRYYWCAAGALLFGKGLVTLRLSEAAFQAIGLFVGLVLANRIGQGWGFLVAVGLLLLLWMFPSHKLFDHTLLICGIWVAVRMIEQPSPARVFTAGIFLGLCVFFGKNHGLYNFLGQVALLSYLAAKSRLFPLFPQLGIWASGVVVGLIPMIGLFVCVSGFGASYVESVRSILRGGTNLPLPIPWPWRTSLFSTLFATTQFLLGMLLVAALLFYLGTIIAALFMRTQVIKDNAVVIACAFIGLFYLHHAFSRADFSHLAQVIHPFILGTLALPCVFAFSKSYRWGLIAILIAVACIGLGRQTPIFQRLTSRTRWQPLEAGSKIFVPPSTASQIGCLQRFTAANISPGAGVLIAPFMPGLYPILNRESPSWELTYLFPATAERETEMILRLTEKDVNWAIIFDAPPEFRLSNTHRLLWQYLTANFAPVTVSCLPASVKILRRKF